MSHDQNKESCMKHRTCSVADEYYMAYSSFESWSRENLTASALSSIIIKTSQKKLKSGNIYIYIYINTYKKLGKRMDRTERATSKFYFPCSKSIKLNHINIIFKI